MLNLLNRSRLIRSISQWAISFICLTGIIAGVPKRPLPVVKNRNWDEHRWLLLFSPNAQNQYLQEQNRLLSQAHHGLADRNIVVVQILADAVDVTPATTEKMPDAAELRTLHRVNPEHFTLILVGKDGEEKYRAPHAQAPAVLFQMIDDMPMRQQERQQKRKE